MTTSKIGLILLSLIGLLFWIMYIESEKDKKLFVIATVNRPIIQGVSGSIPIVTITTHRKNTAPVVPTIQTKKQTKAVTKSTVKEVVAKPPVNPKRITKKGFEDNQHIQDLVNHAYKIGGRDFLLTVEGENGLWQRDRKSGLVWANWFSDYWLCQLNAKYHRKWIFANKQNLKDWFSKEFQDWYNQLNYCWEVFQDWIKKGRLKTTFYAYNKRHDKAQRFHGLE